MLHADWDRGPWNPWLLGPWDPEALGLWDLKTQRPWDPASADGVLRAVEQRITAFTSVVEDLILSLLVENFGEEPTC